MNIFYKYTFLILLSFVCALTSKAQITLQNPSFEADGIGDNSIIPLYWHSCYQNNCGTFPDTLLNFKQPKAPDGNFYSAIAYSLNNIFKRSMSSELSCPTLNNKSHNFSIYLRSEIPPPTPSFPDGYSVKGVVKIWLGKDSCIKDELIWQS